MNQNKEMELLFDECLAYIIFGREISPSHVKDMIKRAYRAGVEDGAEDTYRQIFDPMHGR
ncbi:hypothetical protein AB1L07_02435 [Niallia alba]|uniref:hypothetical protein n=1 Tax=Niallia alba TaxID=2729105 RepID=UPI0039A0CFAA